jgi:peptidoglycan/xylan/chitin deacetylase (PgdA/CDA1 family)
MSFPSSMSRMSRISTALSSVALPLARAAARSTSLPAARRVLGFCTLSLSALACSAAAGSDAVRDSAVAPAANAADVTADSAPSVTVQNDAAGMLATPAPAADAGGRTPNEMGRIPVLEYHLIVPEEKGEFTRTPERLRKDLELLRERGYVPVNMTDVIDKKIQSLPRGKSPVVLVFDDASPSQFRYIERNGSLGIDPTTAVGILEKFSDEHRDWPRKAVFCMLPAAQAGRSFFGDKGIEGQKTEWRFQKVQFLHKQGYELCNHTLYHARLDRAGTKVEEYIARGDMAIDSAVPGYKVRTFALPLGMWPKNRALASSGSWTDPKSKKTIRYKYDAVLEVSGNPNESVYDPKFNPNSVNRQIMFKNALEVTLNHLDKPGPGGRYVSDGDPGTVAKP